jgi:hypothetical protein
MLREYGAAAATRQRLRADLATLPALIAASGNWEVAPHRRMAVQNQGPFVASDVLRLYQAWTDLCEGQAALRCDFDDVRSELRSWAQSSASQSVIALQLIECRFEPGRRI